MFSVALPADHKMTSVSAQIMNKINNDERISDLDEEELSMYAARDFQLYLFLLNVKIFANLDETERLTMASDDSNCAARRKRKCALG